MRTLVLIGALVGCTSNVGPCTSGLGCVPSSVCHAGRTQCTASGPTCVDQLMPLPDGTACGTDSACVLGSCVPRHDPGVDAIVPLTDGGPPPPQPDAGPATVGDPIGPPPPAGRAWSIVFDDEFDDADGMSGPTHGLAPDKWNDAWYQLGLGNVSDGVVRSASEWYGPEAIAFPGDGSVHLRVLDQHSPASASFDKPYEAGAINTATHFVFSASETRTVIESRMQVAGPDAQASGYWPVYVLFSALNGPGGPGQWPPEINIFEFFGDSTRPVAHLHTVPATDPSGRDINQGFDDSDGRTDMSLAFHVYTLDMSASAFVFYLDGAEQWRYTDTSHIANLLRYDPMYVMMQFEYGGAGGPTTGRLPADWLIDYVRVWQ